MARVTVTARQLSRLPEVRAAVRRTAEAHSAVARADLAGHRDTGAAEIVTTQGAVDAYSVLSDDRGQRAAMSIEFGRRPNPRTGRGGMVGLFVLHRAYGLTPKRGPVA
jgi:Family of unknown function (DUF5403)